MDMLEILLVALAFSAACAVLGIIVAGVAWSAWSTARRQYEADEDSSPWDHDDE